MEAEYASSGSAAALPPAVPPFLTKCYDIVDDPATNKTISWARNGKSFVIWDEAALLQDLLPKYYKHNNLLSFFRQLNAYGFRKVGGYRCEFANEWFVKGKKHLLKDISRKKPAQVNSQQHNSQATSSGFKACVEVGNFGLLLEMERLKRYDSFLMQEVVKLRQQQQHFEEKLHGVIEHIQGMEQSQQQMTSLLARALNGSNVLGQMVQQNVSSKAMPDSKKKRGLPALDCCSMDGFMTSYHGPIIDNQAFVAETSVPIVMSGALPVLHADATSNMQLRPDGANNIFSNVNSMSPGTQSSFPAEGNFQLPDMPAYMEQLLASPVLENNGEIDPDLGIPDFSFDLDFPGQDI